MKKTTKWINFIGGSNLLFTVGVAFLAALTVLILTQIDFIFTPIVVIASNVLMPLIIAILLYYLLDPLVSLLSKKMNRIWAVAIVFILIFFIIGLLTAFLIPLLEDQVTNLIETMPVFIENVLSEAQTISQNLPANDFFSQLIEQAQSIADSLFNNFGDILSTGLTNVSGLVDRKSVV